MDPLTVLPPELVRLVVRLLAPVDLLSLAGVSRAWRCAAKDPALWDAVRLRFPGDPPGLLRLAPAIAELELRVADLKPRHLLALLAGHAEVQRLTCLPAANGDQDVSANAATLVRILQRMSPSLRSLSILCDVSYDRPNVPSDRERALQIIVAMPRLRELRLGDMNFGLGRLPEKLPVPVALRGTLEKLSVNGEPHGSWAKTVLNLLRAHRTSLRSLELHQIGPMEGAVVASIASCRELRSLTLELPLPSRRFNLMSAYKHHTKRIYRQLPKELTHLEHLKLLLPCPFDLDSSEQTDDGEGVGLDELAAGLQKHGGALLSMELVVLCGSAERAEARVEANEARLRAALPDTTVVKASVQHAFCHCTDDTEDDYENDYDTMVDTFYDLAGCDASSYTSDDEGNDDS